MPITLLDGPMGSELNARGVDTRLPLWSARALTEAPEVVAAVHRAYAEAGATVHTTNTFRTQRRTCGEAWKELTRKAVALARSAVPPGHRVAGCIAPLEDCYRPDLSPRNPGPEHREMARALADAGCDLLLCETFPHPGEALAAVDAAVSTGLETWLSLTPGPQADLLTAEQIRTTARAAVEQGVTAVLLNCLPASAVLPLLPLLHDLGVAHGAYANAGWPDEHVGWLPKDAPGDAHIAADYAELAAEWIARGATLVGSCCGTGPDHIRALAVRLGAI